LSISNQRSIPAQRFQTAEKSDLSQVLFVWVAVLVAFLLIQAGANSVAGLWYLVLTIGVVLVKPTLGLAMVFAGVPITHNVSPVGVNLSLAEIALSVVMVRALIGGKVKLMPVILPIALYLLICMLSSAITYRGRDAVVSWLQMVNFFIFTLIAFSVYGRNIKAVVLALTAIVGTSCVLSILLVLQGGGGYLYGIHKNSIGATTATSLVIAVEMWFRATAGNEKKRKRLWLVLIMILSLGLFFTLSRGAWGSAVIGVLILTAVRGRWTLLLRFSAVLLPIAITGFFFLGEGTQEYIAGSVDTETHSFEMRRVNAEVAWSYFQQNPVFGQGLGIRKQQDATNIILFTMAETGVIGLAAFLMIHVVALWLAFKYRPRIDVRSSAFSILGLAIALMFGRLAHGMVDHYWSRGALTVVWSMVGALLAVTAQIPRQRPAKRAR